MTVTPATGISASGPVGGPFSGGSQNYTVTNSGTASLDFTVTDSPTWITTAPASGMLAAGASTTIAVSINSGANALAAGAYNGTVTITNTTNGSGDTSRAVALTVTAVGAAAMTVTPATGITSTGPVGGPFAGGNQNYTVTNSGGTSLSWTAADNQTWVTTTPASGALAPGATATVAVSINSGANSLVAGSYSATVTFTNTTNGAGNTTRGVSLTIGSGTGSVAGAYDMGTPTLLELYVNGATGNDTNNGTSAATALKTIGAAWNKVPFFPTPGSGALSTTGYRINIATGSYTVPNYWEGRHGTFQFPVILRASSGPGTVTIPYDVNIFDCTYLYIIDLKVVAGGEPIHFDSCDHVLLKGVTATGTGLISDYTAPKECVKVNQSKYLYVEDCDISNAWDNAFDCVGVQYGHFYRNKIHKAGDWCMYLKGGSAYFRVEGNEFYDGGTGGFTAGQGTGFEFMTPPWLHYEAYDIKFVNNLIHDTSGAGVGVNGGYNILIAFNTMYRVGSISHVIEVVFGARSVDGDTTTATNYNSQGGWGPTTTGVNVDIPDRNVMIVNNIVYNPPGFQSAWQHFAVYGPVTPPAGSNVPNPARCDTGLVIKGNIIWNGSSSMPIGFSSGVTLSEAQVIADNAINTIQPQFVNAAGGDFHPTATSNILGYACPAMVDFTWADAPTTPAVPAGNNSNAVTQNRDGAPRTGVQHPGAY